MHCSFIEQQKLLALKNEEKLFHMQLKGLFIFIFLCVVRVRACVRAGGRVCVRTCMRSCVRVCVRACLCVYCVILSL